MGRVRNTSGNIHCIGIKEGVNCQIWFSPRHAVDARSTKYGLQMDALPKAAKKMLAAWTYCSLKPGAEVDSNKGLQVIGVRTWSGSVIPGLTHYSCIANIHMLDATYIGNPMSPDQDEASEGQCLFNQHYRLNRIGQLLEMYWDDSDHVFCLHDSWEENPDQPNSPVWHSYHQRFDR